MNNISSTSSCHFRLHILSKQIGAPIPPYDDEYGRPHLNSHKMKTTSSPSSRIHSTYSLRNPMNELTYRSVPPEQQLLLISDFVFCCYSTCFKLSLESLRGGSSDVDKAVTSCLHRVVFSVVMASGQRSAQLFTETTVKGSRDVHWGERPFGHSLSPTNFSWC